MIDRLLQPLLSLHGWQAYALVGFLVFAEVAILIGIVFPGETAVIVGGVVASRGHANIVVLIIVVVACAIAGKAGTTAMGTNAASAGPARTRKLDRRRRACRRAGRKRSGPLP